MTQSQKNLSSLFSMLGFIESINRRLIASDPKSFSSPEASRATGFSPSEWQNTWHKLPDGTAIDAEGYHASPDGEMWRED